MHDPGMLVLYEAGAPARRALAAAAAGGAPITVVAIAPRDLRGPRCGAHGPELGLAIEDAARRELDAARAALGERALEARFVVLRTGADGELGAWAARAGFTTALLGARRSVLGVRRRDARARSLRRAGVDVRTVT